MPILKSSIKQMKQSEIRRKRNLPLRSKIKTVYKNSLKLISEEKFEEAKDYLPRAYKVIDMGVKKNIIHKNTANRKKSRIAKGISKIEKEVANKV